ncbi:MAG: TatD family hydrolase [Candidatus Moranbacteria bacterium]|nr:TatD family hydrolase [Candidatus Moranbacteria bacterium]
MIDIHTHLHFKDYDADRDAVIARAREAGVEKMILVGTDLESSRTAIALSEKHDFLFASVGIHPHFFNEVEKEFPISNFQFPNKSQFPISKFQTEIKGITELAKHPKVVAIGECGLDYFVRNEQGATNNEQGGAISNQQKKIQEEGFLAQMEIAKELGLPLIIHTRPSVGTMDAYEDVFEILKNHLSLIPHPASAFILHCYQGDTEITKKLLGLPNAHFSFAGSVTYPVKKSLIGTKDDSSEVVKLVPMERIFVETDCPYLAPQPMRGSRNEPAYVTMTAERMAETKGTDVKELESTINRVFSRVFGRSKMET